MKRGFYRKSIRSQIFWCMLGLAILLTAILTVSSISRSRRDMQESLLANAQNVMELLSDQLNYEMKTHERFFYTVETDKDLKRGIVQWTERGEADLDIMERLRTVCEKELNQDPHTRSIEVIDLETGIGFLATRSGFAPSRVGDASALFQGKRQTHFVISREENGYCIAHLMVDFYTRVPYAAILLHMKESLFTDYLEDALQPDAACFLMDENDLLMASFGGAQEEARMEDLPSIVRQKHPLLRIEGAFWFYRSVFRGKIGLVMVRPTSFIENRIMETVWFALGMALLGLALALGGSRLFARTISGPIMRLSRKMREVDIARYEGEGKEVISSGNEVDHLQNSFDAMLVRNRDLIAREYQAEIEKQNAQLASLQMQINPHFLYNTLQTIGSMSVAGCADQIYPVVTNLSDLLRYAIGSEERYVPLRRELQALEKYIQIQNTRFDGRIVFRAEEAEEVMSLMIPKLILQPLVENSLEHGLADQSGPWEITVEAKREGGLLILTVADNGCGMDDAHLADLRGKLGRGYAELLTSSAHIGLANVNARISLLPGMRNAMSIDSEEGRGTCITIWLEEGATQDGWDAQGDSDR